MCKHTHWSTLVHVDRCTHTGLAARKLEMRNDLIGSLDRIAYIYVPSQPKKSISVSKPPTGWFLFYSFLDGLCDWMWGCSQTHCSQWKSHNESYKLCINPSSQGWWRKCPSRCPIRPQKTLQVHSFHSKILGKVLLILKYFTWRMQNSSFSQQGNG